MRSVLFCCTLFILTACSGGDASKSSSDKTPKLTKSESTSPATTTSKTARTAMKPIQLNDGKPWKADEEMIQRVAAMQEVLEENRSAENINRTAVVESLDQHTSEFIASCTMKGQGHEELHKWLEPYMGLIKKLDKAKSDAEAKDIMDAMTQMLQDFGNYFE